MNSMISKFVTSRKFMISIATCIAPVIAIAFKVDEKLVMDILDKVTPLVMVYVGGEAAADIVSRLKKKEEVDVVKSKNKHKLNG